MEAQGGNVLRQTRTETEMISNHNVQEANDTSLHGGLLVLARVVWIVVVVLVVVVFGESWCCQLVLGALVVSVFAEERCR